MAEERKLPKTWAYRKERSTEKLSNTTLIIRINIFIFGCILLLTSCGIYSFSGTSIPPEVETFSVQYFDNTAAIVSPGLSQTFTEKLKSKFTSETNLSITETNGDFSFSGNIIDYTVAPVAARNTDAAQLNRLSISIKAQMICDKKPALNFDQTFTKFQDFEASTNFSTIESQLIDEITDQLVQEVFNKAAINW